MMFPDVSNESYYAKFIEKASDLGIMIGDDKGNFRPNDALTRAEAAVIVCRIMDRISQEK
jgi:hypothetical protein